MRVQVTPERVELTEDNAVEVFVTVHNTGDLIGGYHLRVLGADPTWVTLETENLSLFPDASETVRALVRIPHGVAAGERRIAVQVRELTPPQAISIAEIELVVPPQQALRLTLTPMTVIAGRAGTFGVILENTGNTTVVAPLAGTDAEDVMRFEFVPQVLTLAPGDQAIGELKASGPRRWFGSPVVRAFGIGLKPEPAAPPAPNGPAPNGPAPNEPAQNGTAPDRSAAPIDPTGKPLASDEPLATGTLLQKPRISRAALSLLSLLLAVTVFATVITIALSAVVGQSAQDRDLAIQIAAARNSVAIAGSSTLGGTVVLLTNGAPVAGVTVELYAASATTVPVKQTATGADGTWKIDQLPSGSYLFRVTGAGFAEIWYPAAASASDATAVTVQVGQQITDLQVALGGLPASVSGLVVGTDVAGAVLTVQVPVEFLPQDAVDRGRRARRCRRAHRRTRRGGAADGADRLGRKVRGHRHSVPPGLRPGRRQARLRHRGAARRPVGGRIPDRCSAAAAHRRRADQRDGHRAGRPARRRGGHRHHRDHQGRDRVADRGRRRRVHRAGPGHAGHLHGDGDLARASPRRPRRCR